MKATEIYMSKRKESKSRRSNSNSRGIVDEDWSPTLSPRDRRNGSTPSSSSTESSSSDRSDMDGVFSLLDGNHDGELSAFEFYHHMAKADTDMNLAVSP